MNKAKEIFAIIIIVSLPASAVFNIWEIWTGAEVANKLKWTAMTLFMTALLMGLLIQSAERQDKTPEA